MGYIAHHCIVVTSWKEESVKAAHEKASELFGSTVTPMQKSLINSYFTFFIGPDGSKEGWAESHCGDQNRNAFFEWLREQNMFLHAVEIRYGGDDPKLAQITEKTFYTEIEETLPRNQECRITAEPVPMEGEGE